MAVGPSEPHTRPHTAITTTSMSECLRLRVWRVGQGLEVAGNRLDVRDAGRHGSHAASDGRHYRPSHARDTVNATTAQAVEQWRQTRKSAQLAQLCVRTVGHHPVEPVRASEPWDFTLPERNGKRFGGTVAYVGLDAFAVPTIGADGKREWKMLNVGLLYDPHKEHTIYLTGFDQKDVAEQLRVYAIAFDLGRAERVVALTDGGAGLEPALGRHFGARVTFVLDFWHACEHLHETSRVWHGESGAGWAEQAVGVMRQSGGAGLLEWLAAHGPPEESSEPVSETWRRLLGFVSGNIHRMEYPTYRSRGWDIGSGPTEAGCKIVGSRLRGAGLKWWKPQPAHVTGLRALLLSNEGLWEGFWNNPRPQAACLNTTHIPRTYPPKGSLMWERAACKDALNLIVRSFASESPLRTMERTLSHSKAAGQVGTNDKVNARPISSRQYGIQWAHCHYCSAFVLDLGGCQGERNYP